MAVEVTELIGIDKVLLNLNKEIKKIEGRTIQGLSLAALHVKGKAQESTPVDHGNLRASAFVITPAGKTAGPKGGKFRHRKSGSARRVDLAKMSRDHSGEIKENQKEAQDSESAIVGYSAYYALFVHEIDKFYTVGAWKFLEWALRSQKGMILKIIKDRVKIK